MKLALLTSTAVLVALAGCAEDSGTLGPATTNTAPPATAPRVGASVAPRPDATYEAWLVRRGTLYRSLRSGRAGERAVARRALAALGAGPTPAEARRGIVTLVTGSDRPAVRRIENGVAEVATGPEFERGDRRTRRLRAAQVVYTLTQYRDTIEAVRLAPGGPPLRRRSFEDVAPPIVVDDPRPGATTTSPLTITGTANVFEATVSIRVLDAERRTIARTFTTATCGSGCRGTFSTAVRYAVDRAQAGTVEVFEVSAEDGSSLHLVAVPVRLSRPAP